MAEQAEQDPAVPAWAQAAPAVATAAAPSADVPGPDAPVGPGSPVDAPGPVSRPDLDLAPGPDPRGTRLALTGLLTLTALGWLWNLDRNGWANTFYAAAVQAGTQSWKAFFFGSSDAGNFITVDKPPVSLWVMALSGRVFGFSSWSMLAPNVLLGVGAVGLLYLTVRRPWGAAAGLLSAAGLAVTPVAALMFRFDNPDAALTFLLVLAAWTLTRALDDGRWRWLLLTAVVLGTAFLAKSLQALLVLPGLALAYLVAGPPALGRRVVRLLAAGGVLAVAGLWWMLLVEAIPASRRPYAGGSTDDSPLSLALGFNGLGRLTGAEGAGRPAGPGGGLPGGPSGGLPGGLPGGGPGGFGGGPGGGPGGGVGGGPGAGFGGTPGPGRMFNDLFGGEIAWLLPAALLALAVGLWLTRRAPRTDPRRASLLLWGGWLVVTAGVFSFMNGIVHTYYTVALAPAVAALAGMLLPALWRGRGAPAARAVLVALVLLTAGTAFVLLGRADGWQPWLRWAVVAAAVVAAAGLALPPAAGRGRRVAGAVAGLAVASAVAAPVAWSAQTISTTHTGSVPTSGPSVRADAAQGGGVAYFRRLLEERGFVVPAGRPGQVPGGAPGSAGTSDGALVALVSQDASEYTWVAAAASSREAGPLQLASGHPVMALGGFDGRDPAITLDGFKALVAARKVHYFVGGQGSGRPGGFGGPGGRDGATSQVAQWVAATFTPRTVGGTTVYDLTQPAG